MLSPRPLPTFASELYCQASHLCVFSLLNGPIHSLHSLSCSFCMAGPFSFLRLFPKRPSLLSPEGCGLGEKEQPPWGVATREGREGVAV